MTEEELRESSERAFQAYGAPLDDSWHGLPNMPGSRDSFRVGVRETDDGRELFVPGVAEGKDSVQGVREGDGAWVASGAHEDATWEGGGGKTDLGSHPLRRGTADVPDGLPERGRTMELPV